METTVSKHINNNQEIAPGDVLSAAILSGIAVIMFNAMPLYVGVVAEGLSLSNQEVGLLASSYFLGHTLAALSVLLWIRRVNWRRVAMMTSALVAAGFFIAAQAHAYWLISGVLFCSGLAGGVLYVTAMTSLGSSRDSERSYGWGSVCQVGFGALVLFSFPVWVIPLWGHQGVTIGFAALFCIGVLFSRWLPEADRKQRTETAWRWGTVMRPLASLTALFLFFTGTAGVWAFIERYGASANFSPHFIGTSLSIAMVSGGVGSLVPATIGSRYGRIKPMCIAGLVMLAVIWLVGLVSSQWVYGVGLAVYQFCWTVVLVYLWADIAANDATGHFTPLTPAAMGVGAVVGPGLAGWLTSENYFSLFPLVTVTTFCSLLVILWATAISSKVGSIPET